MNTLRNSSDSKFMFFFINKIKNNFLGYKGIMNLLKVGSCIDLTIWFILESMTTTHGKLVRVV